MTFDEIAELALALPQATEGERHGHRSWAVGKKVFAWERQFSKADVKRYGTEIPPSGEILAVSVADLDDKEAVLAEGRPGFFTIPHFQGYAAVLIQLEVATDDDLREALTDAWLAQAPAALAATFRPDPA